MDAIIATRLAYTAMLSFYGSNYLCFGSNYTNHSFIQALMLLHEDEHILDCLTQEKSVSAYFFLRRLSSPVICRFGPLNAPASSRSIADASPPELTAFVTILANCHIPPSRSKPPPTVSVISATSFIVCGSKSTSKGFL
mmetsp:Transcript_22210/g.36772  ORF Transcript_22210/g.36772 Transcript_22210/m.36772 type:complete len:139 (-) Transcript_22210:624-1040(-)